MKQWILPSLLALGFAACQPKTNPSPNPIPAPPARQPKDSLERQFLESRARWESLKKQHQATYSFTFQRLSEDGEIGYNRDIWVVNDKVAFLEGYGVDFDADHVTASQPAANLDSLAKTEILTVDAFYHYADTAVFLRQPRPKIESIEFDSNGVLARVYFFQTIIHPWEGGADTVEIPTAVSISSPKLGNTRSPYHNTRFSGTWQLLEARDAQGKKRRLDSDKIDQFYFYSDGGWSCYAQGARCEGEVVFSADSALSFSMRDTLCPLPIDLRAVRRYSIERIGERADRLRLYTATQELFLFEHPNSRHDYYD